MGRLLRPLLHMHSVIIGSFLFGNVSLANVGTQAEFVKFCIQKSADFLVKCAMLLFDEFTFQAWLHQLTWIWYCIPPARLTSMFWQPLNHEGITVLGMDQKKVLINPNCQRHIFRSNFVTYTGSLSTECNKLRLLCCKEPLRLSWKYQTYSIAPQLWCGKYGSLS